MFRLLFSIVPSLSSSTYTTLGSSVLYISLPTQVQVSNLLLQEVVLIAPSSIRVAVMVYFIRLFAAAKIIKRRRNAMAEVPLIQRAGNHIIPLIGKGIYIWLAGVGRAVVDTRCTLADAVATYALRCTIGLSAALAYTVVGLVARSTTQ